MTALLINSGHDLSTLFLKISSKGNTVLFEKDSSINSILHELEIKLIML